MKRDVIVGGGLAGINAARVIRKPTSTTDLKSKFLTRLIIDEQTV